MAPRVPLTRDPHELMTAVFRNALRYCDQNPGYNLPEMIRAALEQVCEEVGESADWLVRHRPGSWEAQLILTLAAQVDWYPSA